MKGILFKPKMIKAIVAGSKIVTRRAMKLQPPDYCDKAELLETGLWNFYKSSDHNFHAYLKGKPRYKVGETVYIKETYAPFLRLDYVGDKCGFRVQYKIDDAVLDRYCTPEQAEKLKVKRGIRWDTPLFMPEWVARYFLKIKGVSIEKLKLPLLTEELEREGGEAALPMLEKIDGLWVWRYEFELLEVRNK